MTLTDATEAYDEDTINHQIASHKNRYSFYRSLVNFVDGLSKPNATARTQGKAGEAIRPGTFDNISIINFPGSGNRRIASRQTSSNNAPAAF
jgi:hypothetical protein